MLVVVTAVRRVAMTVVQVIHVVAVGDRDVTAVGPVLVRVPLAHVMVVLGDLVVERLGQVLAPTQPPEPKSCPGLPWSGRPEYR